MSHPSLGEHCTRQRNLPIFTCNRCIRRIMETDKDIRIAIHHTPGSFSDSWIEYCTENRIAYSLVNCYDTDIIQQLKDYDLLLWNWHHADAKAILFARQLFMSLEHMPIRVYPDINTCWHFDDKVGQKYLLESAGVQLIPSYVFYDKEEAMEWIDRTEFPKVFKLRCGAGSLNVRLARNASEARRLCKKAFGKGFSAHAGYFADAANKMRKARKNRDYLGKIRRMPSSIMGIYLANRRRGREKGYVYFQDFIPNNTYDTRIVIIGKKCFGLRRYCRKNDFRASSSDRGDYSREAVDERCVSMAFDVAKKIGSQSLAMDFLLDVDESPCLAEISYCFPTHGWDDCEGYWDEALVWHAGEISVVNAIIEDQIGKAYLQLADANPRSAESDPTS